MNPTIRNKYIDGDVVAAKAVGCDTVQLKYDGHWCKCVSYNGQQRYFSDTDRQFLTTDFLLPDCVLVGEFMRGTQWSQQPERKGRYFLFDIWSFGGEPVDNMTYRERYSLLRAIVRPTNFDLILSYPITMRDQVWNMNVATEEFEGLVYRNSRTTDLGVTLIREKRIVTIDGVVTGFVPGEGKHAGRLGALELRLSNGATTTLGNGFSDLERDHIWFNQPAYLGRVCELTAASLFDSGIPRHARFVRFKTP